MKYIVIIDVNGTWHAFIPPGGGWLDRGSAAAWAADYVGDNSWPYHVLALEFA